MAQAHEENQIKKWTLLWQ